MKVATESVHAVRLRIKGIVQGVGFRPFVYRLATRLSLRGWVINRTDGVMIHAEGGLSSIDSFLAGLKYQAPDAAVLEDIEERAALPLHLSGFEIRKSRPVPGLVTGISPDIAVCNHCLSDIKNQSHRTGYPLVNCTGCGPRFSIIRDTPYDRINTTMDHFAMCGTCKSEYHDPDNRRFHAQPVSCNHCGPSYEVISGGHGKTMQGVPGGTGLPGKISAIDVSLQTEQLSLSEINVNGAGINYHDLCRTLEKGGVALIKGTGGYHIVCDAMNMLAVSKVREMKGRDGKPFAVMFRSVHTVKNYCTAGADELDILQSWRRPVVIMKEGKKRMKVNGRGVDTVGAILPYMPFHYLLFEYLKVDALVFTSANMSGEPLVADDQDAMRLFSDKVDIVIRYNREILNPSDDSVCRVSGGNLQIIRRARGYVPEMIRVPFKSDEIFAAGGDLKNTFALGKGNRVIMSQYTGDMESFRAFSRYRYNLERLSKMFRVTPAVIAFDMHPEYHTSRFAVGFARDTGCLPVAVQHHHAHIASCMAEHGIDEKVIGVCFDGTGYGDDGKIWGSEFMICDYSGYTRHGHFACIPLPGGDAAIREPWRTALSFLRVMGHGETDRWITDVLKDIEPDKIETADKMIRSRINSPMSCGAGRLFDAVSALTGLCLEAGYDGEAPVLLETICTVETERGYDFAEGVFDVIGQVMDDIKRDCPKSVIASRFHNGLAEYIVSTVKQINQGSGIGKVVLSGGVFQNSYLLTRTMFMLGQAGLKVFTNRLVPVNDGGISLGQVAIASKKR